MSWDELGLNLLLERPLPQTEEQADADAELLSPNPISTGVATSKDGIIKIDLENNRITRSDGRLERQLLPSPDLIVAQDGSGDFGDIQQAIDYAKLIGGATILIKEGSYELLSSIIYESNVHIIGQDIDGVVLNFINATADYGPSGLGTSVAGVVVDGLYRDVGGTISVTNGSALVTGLVTVFTNAQPGDKIDILGQLYEIDSIISDTSLRLTKTYFGRTKSSLTTTIIKPVSNVSLRNLTIKNGKNAGLYVVRGDSVFLDFVKIRETSGDGNGFYCEGTYGLQTGVVYPFGNGGTGSAENQNNGVYLLGVESAYFEKIISTNNKGAGVYIAGSDRTQITEVGAHLNNQGVVIDTSDQCTIESGKAIGNVAEGFYLEGNSNAVIEDRCKDNVLLNCLARENGGDGFRIHDESDGGGGFGQSASILTRNQFKSCRSINNGGWGLRLSLGGGANSSGLTNNVIEGFDPLGNTSGGMSDLGSGTVKDPFYKAPAAVVIPSDTNENDVASFTIPAGTLGIDGSIHMHVVFAFLNNSGAARTLTVRFYWGGTLCWTQVPYAGLTTNGGGQYAYDLYLSSYNDNASVQHQRMTAHYSHPGGLADGNNETAYTPAVQHGFGDISKDSNVNQILKMTTQVDTAADTGITLWHAFVEGCN